MAAVMTDAIIDYWTKNGLKIKRVNIDEINSILSEKKINLPGDFKDFYHQVNGMENCASDSEGFSFYPLTEIKTIEERFLTKNDISNIVLFSDYMQESWWYGIKIDSDNDYKIGIIPNENTFTIITDSLEQFVELYLQDSNKLYEWQ